MTNRNLPEARYAELLALAPADRRRQPNEIWMDAFCETCGTSLRGEGYAVGKSYCAPCAHANGVDCSRCGFDAGNGAGGYSNCCGAPVGR